MAQGSIYLTKQFGFIKVEWIVKNYCVTTDGLNKEFYSPHFYVRGIHYTKWRMILKRFVSENHYNVSFCLQRLQCSQFLGLAVVDCVLEYSDRHEQFIEIDFKTCFGVNSMSVEELKLKFAGAIPTKHNHSNEFIIKCDILVNFLKARETPAPCQIIGLNRLSEDMVHLYEDGIMRDFEFSFGTKSVYAHKAILLHRITNKEFKKRITPSDSIIEMVDFQYEAVEKVVRFLYSSNMKYPLTDPTISVYRFAKFLCVKPIIAYYEPDKIKLTSAIEVEEYNATWTIDCFRDRKERFVLSPVMTNKMKDTKWRLQVYPKGVGKNSEYILICLKIESRIQKDICAKLFLKDKPESGICYSCHKSVINEQVIVQKNFISLDNVRNNYGEKDNLTIGLQLRISTGEESSEVCESVSGDYYFYEQKNYHELANDILSVYQNQRFADMTIDFTDHNVKISLHECILHVRCTNLLHMLKNNLNYFVNINNAVLFELFSFLYSAKLGGKITLEDIFCLYRIAGDINFISLKSVIIENLRALFTKSNSRCIYEFANAERIENLRESAECFIE